MPFDVTVTRTTRFVRYDVAGPTSLKHFSELIIFMAADTAHFEDAVVLVDVTAVEGRLTFTEQLLVGEMGALKLPYVFKIASLVPPGEITRNTERAAAKKGMQGRAFDCEEEALAWLLAPDQL